MSVTELNKDNFEKEVMEAEVPVLIDFWANWCGPCRMMSPIIDKIAEEMGDKVKVCKVNVDENHELAEKYKNISGSDISTAVLNAAFKAARQEKRMVDKEYIFEAIEDITKSKEANQGYTVTTKNVSKEYVKEQLGYLPDSKE